MAFPWLMLVQIAAQKKQQQEAERAARVEALASSHARSAARYGFPTDQYEADKFNKQFTDADAAGKSEFLGGMLGMLGGSFGAKQGQGYSALNSPESQELADLSRKKGNEAARESYFRMGRERGLW